MKKVVISVFIVIFVFGFIMSFFYTVKRIYPLKYSEYIGKYSSEFELSSTLVSSLINIESSFNKMAESNAGAKGLMQLRDSTAKEIANKLNIDNYTESEIFNEEINIRFGCFYLRYLLDYYKNNLDLALCAYNAGMGTVNSWIKNAENFEKGILKKIPYKETENYLIKIKNGKKIYEYLYGMA